MQNKICSTCNVEKPISEFYSRSANYRAKYNCDSRHGVCKDCFRIRRNIHRKANPEFRRHEVVRDLYGITIAQYKQMVIDQKGLCAICGQPETWRWKGKLCGLTVDHDHKTGKIRGLLCNACNRALGNFHDSQALLESAIAYLKSHS